MRKITDIIVHCSASDVDAHDDISVIKEWHLARMFQDVGYHYFITKGGQLQEGRPLSMIGAHCHGHNDKSIGICLSGNTQFTHVQFFTLGFLMSQLLNDHQDVKRVKPHNYYNKLKTCPNFELPIFDFEVK